MGKRIFEKNQIQNITWAHAWKGTVMITIEYKAKINENEKQEFLTNVEAKLFEQTLFILLRCGYNITSITIMKQ